MDLESQLKEVASASFYEYFVLFVSFVVVSNIVVSLVRFLPRGVPTGGPFMFGGGNWQRVTLKNTKTGCPAEANAGNILLGPLAFVVEIPHSSAERRLKEVQT